MEDKSEDSPTPYEVVEQPAAPSQSSQVSPQRRKEEDGIARCLL